MDTSKARTDLGWTPRYSADEALLDLLEGLRTGSGFDTPPLSPKTSGRFRIREILTGVGGREPVKAVVWHGKKTSGLTTSPTP